MKKPAASPIPQMQTADKPAKALKKIIAIILLGVILLASLLACGYFGAKTLRRSQQRRAAMAAYERKDYGTAERLLRAYVRKDPNSEPEFVALAKIYHELGNTGMEAQMWQTASSLNPLNQEYRENMLTSAVKSASYSLLHSILGRKAKVNEKLTDQELYLYVISSYRSGYPKDGNDAYKKAVGSDPEAFHKNELGRMAEFITNYSDLSDSERDAYLYRAQQSNDPVIQFEALYFLIRRMNQNDDNLEELLKQAVEVNYFVGTPLLADFYFSKNRFEDVNSILEPYLKTIDDLNLYLLYAECYAFEGKLDELKALEQKLRRKPGTLSIMADYCEILIAYLEDDEEKLAAAVRKTGNIIFSPLSRFIRLRVAMTSKSFNEIRTIAQELFSAPPFYDLHGRAMLICLNYISEEMKKPENQKDPSQMAELAKILSGYLPGNRLLTEVILVDQHKRGLAKEADLTAALEEFPDDALLQRITAEHLIFNGKAEQAMSILKPVLAAAATEEAKQELNRDFLFLYMLALEQLGQRDEASAIFRKLVEQSGFDLDLLIQYFQFCRDYNREDDLRSMADKLDTVKDGNMEHFGVFFRAAAMLLTEDKDKEKEALDLLAANQTEVPEFTMFAANRLSEHDRLDEAETKYKAILKTYRFPALIYVNLSELYHAKDDRQKALDAAKEAYNLEKKSMLPAFIYAKRLSEAGRFEEAVSALNFPRHAVNYREDVVALWCDCMRHVIEKSMDEERFSQAEEQCKHLLLIVPDDEFGTETMEKLRELLKPKKDGEQNGAAEDDADPAA